MPTELNPNTSNPPQAQPKQAPDFGVFAGDYLQKAFGKPVSWDGVDAEVAALPKDPTTGKATQSAEDVRKRVVDSYVNDVLPQYYPREVLPQMQAKVRSDLDAKLTASALGSPSATTPDPKTAGYDSLIRLEGELKDPVKRAENTIALDKASRANGKKLIGELGLSQIDAEARGTLIQEEIDKRRALSKVIVDKFSAGEIPVEQAQADIDRLGREVTSLNGALLDTKDASTWSTEAVWAAGGVGKALISLPEFVGRVVNGTTNWLTDKPFATGFSDESGAVVGSMAQARQWITKNVEDWDIGDPSQVKLDAVVKAFDDGGLGGGLDVAANHPEVALRLLATSGVDSVAQFLAGGYAGAGTSAVVKGAMGGVRSVAELNVLAQGAATARMVGGIGSSTSYAALTDADDTKRQLSSALNDMSVDKFLSLEEVQKENSVWKNLQGDALNTYIASKKQAIIDDAYTKVAGTTAAILAASGYVGSKYGVEAWLLGRKDALGAAAGASMGKRLTHGAVSAVVGGTHEGLEEVAETGTQHAFYVSALDKDMHDKTPFSNFSGAFVQGFVVGGVMDGYAGTRAASPSVGDSNTETQLADPVSQQWTDDQLADPKIASRIDSAFSVFGGEASPFSVQGLKEAQRPTRDGTSTPTFYTLDAPTRRRLDYLSQQAGDPKQPASDASQSRARHMLMQETARIKSYLEARDRSDASIAAMNAERAPKKVDPNEWVRQNTEVLASRQMTLQGVPVGGSQFIPSQGDEMRTDEANPAQMSIDFEPAGMNFDWLVHGANNPKSQATGTEDDQLGLPLDAPYSGEDPLSLTPQQKLPFGRPYDASLTPKQYAEEDSGVGTGWQQQLDFSGVGVQRRVENLIAGVQQESQQPTPETPNEPRELPPESNTALALEAGIPVTEHHTSIANQVLDGVGVDVTVDAKGTFHVMLSSEDTESTRIVPVSIANAVDNAKTMLPTANPFDQANLAVKGVMTSITQVSKVKNPAITSAVRYAVLREVLSGLPDNYVTHHPSGRRRSEKQVRKTATTWAGLHRMMVEERARLYDAPRSSAAYDYVVGNRTTLTPRLKQHTDALNDLRSKWFAHQNELESLGTDGIIDALVTAPEKTAKAEPSAPTQTNPVQATVEKVAAVEMAQTVEDLDNGDLMPVEVAADVATTGVVQEQLQEQLQMDVVSVLEDASTYEAVALVEEQAEENAQALGIPLDTTAIDMAYETVVQDVTPEATPQAPVIEERKPETSSAPKVRKRRKAAFEPDVEAEYIVPPVEEDQLIEANYLNNDKKLDAAIRVSELQSRKAKKVPMWKQVRDAELAARQSANISPDAASSTSVDTDVIQKLVRQSQTQHETLNNSVAHDGKPEAATSTQALDFSNGWVAAVTPHLTPAQVSLAEAADAIIKRHGGDNNVYMSFDKGATVGSGGFYVSAWDKTFVRHTSKSEVKSAAATVLHEKLHQALRDVDSINMLRDKELLGAPKSKNAKELAAILDSMENLLDYTRKEIADRTGISNAYAGELYGLTNVYEFRAELSNPAFGRLLAAIEAPNKKGTVLGSVLRAVRKLFGLYVPSVHDVALNDLHRLLQITAGGKYYRASNIVAKLHTRAGTSTAQKLTAIERSGYAKLTPDSPAALYAVAQRDGYGSPAMKYYARSQVMDAPLSAATLNAQFDKMDGC